MKKTLFLFFAGLLMVGSLAFAQEGMMMNQEMKEPMKEPGMGHMMMHGMKGHGMMGKGMKGEMCSTMKTMSEKQMVPSGDGGVIVMVGNKLIKYDKNLNVVKEAEIKVDMEAMKKMMGDCPMMKGKGAMMDEDDKQGKEGDKGQQ